MFSKTNWLESYLSFFSKFCGFFKYLFTVIIGTQISEKHVAFSYQMLIVVVRYFEVLHGN